MCGLDRVKGRVKGVKGATAATLTGRAFQPNTLLEAARVQEVEVRCPGAMGATAAACADGVKAGRVGGFGDGMGLVGTEGAEKRAFKRGCFTALADEGVGKEADEATATGRGVVSGCGLGVVEERDMVEGGSGGGDMG